VNTGISQLGDCVRIDSSSLNPSAHPDRLFHVFSIPGYDNGQRPEHLVGSQIGSNKYVISSECVLVSKINPRIKRVWRIEKPPSESSVCSTEFVQLTPLNGAVEPRFVEHFLLHADLERLTATASQAATKSRQHQAPYFLSRSALHPWTSSGGLWGCWTGRRRSDATPRSAAPRPAPSSPPCSWTPSATPRPIPKTGRSVG